MASTSTIDELLQQPGFHEAVADVYSALLNAQKQHGDGTLRVNLALDVLIFVQAMFQEADPAYAGDKGLTKATTNSSTDHRSMLRFLRDHSQETGRHMLEGLAQRVEAQQVNAPSVDQTGEDIDHESTVDELALAISNAIISASQPLDRKIAKDGLQSAYVRFNLHDVLAALSFVQASITVQSGEAQSQKERRLLADKLRADFVKNLKAVDAQVNSLGPNSR